MTWDPLTPPSHTGATGLRPRRNPNPDPDIARRNIRNRKRGNRTSHDLAAYLGGRNVEALKLPWDVEAKGCRIQSKRLAEPLSNAAIVRLIGGFSWETSALFAVYVVGARARLASGRVHVLLVDWQAEHGWTLPLDAALHNVGGVALLSLPLPTFRDVHVALHGRDEG